MFPLALATAFKFLWWILTLTFLHRKLSYSMFTHLLSIFFPKPMRLWTIKKSQWCTLMFSKFLEYSFCSNYKWFGFSLILIPKSTTGHSHDYGDDLDYSGMETIELCDNVELEDSCILVDNNALYAVSYRTRKLMSFKVASLSLSVTQAPVTVVSLCSQERIFSFYLFKFWMAWLKKKSTGTSFLPFVINFLPITGKNLRKKKKKAMYIKTKMWPSLADVNYISQFHEAPFHGNLEFLFGTLVSHGCIRIQKNFIGSMLHLNETTRKHFCFFFFSSICLSSK